MKNKKRQMLKLHKILLGLCTIILTLNTAIAEACTIFAAAGSMVQGGGTLVGKTDDVKFLYTNTVEKSTSTGYPYYYMNNKERQTNNGRDFCGTNIYGLTVVGAGTNILKQEEIRKIPYNGGSRKILATCKSVEDALKHTECFLRPGFHILADAKEIACIETGLNGKLKITRTNDGILAHTNHYLDITIIGDKKDKAGKDSLTRYNTINELLTSTEGPLTQENFKKFVNDKIIFKCGNPPKSIETAGQMVACLKPDGDFNLYFRYKPNNFAPNYKVIETSKNSLFEK